MGWLQKVTERNLNSLAPHVGTEELTAHSGSPSCLQFGPCETKQSGDQNHFAEDQPRPELSSEI